MKSSPVNFFLVFFKIEMIFPPYLKICGSVETPRVEY